MMYPFNHECQWNGPFYFWTSNQTDEAPPKWCKPVYACRICGAQQSAPDVQEGAAPKRPHEVSSAPGRTPKGRE